MDLSPLIIAAGGALLVVALVLGVMGWIFLASRRLEGALVAMQSQFSQLSRTLADELALARRETADAARLGRGELAQRLDATCQQLGADAKDGRAEAARGFGSISQTLQAGLEGFARQFEGRSEVLRQTVSQALTQMATDNTGKLEEMRKTVAEKLEGTLERRLGDSFKLVSERLEQVHKGLGEMQSLAIGVGDLKKIMTNVKARGTWGEIQLGLLLEQVLSPEQFERNVQTKPDSPGRVEYALKMPHRDGDADACLWLPIDAKFPIETYQRLLEAADRADAAAVELEARQLEAFIKLAARDICEKYISPPDTTDFAVMYLPTEGLFAEVVRRVGVVEYIQREYRVVVAGPTTLAALLNSLQMGFRTLAIQKRSSEVWEVLGAVKAEFGKFDTVLKKVEKKLHEAGNVIDDAHKRSRVIKRRLKTVQELPEGEAARLLNLAVPRPVVGASAADDGDESTELDA